MKKNWIPGQARNDEKMSMQGADNCATACFAGSARVEEKLPGPFIIDGTGKAAES